jgi:hypothetical protein
MSIYAETANSFYLEPRKWVAGFVIATSLLVVAASCDDNNQAGGKPRSPLDTNGTRGSGYTPPGGWDGWYQPKGMAPPGSYTELPDSNTSTKAHTPEGAALTSAITLPGDIMGTTTIVFSFGEEASAPPLPAEADLTQA